MEILVAWAIILLMTAIIALKFLPNIFRKKVRYHFGGETDQKWKKVEERFKENFFQDMEHEGAAFAVYHRGELVVDLWGGYADASGMRKWNEDTMTVVYSCTKAVASLCIAILVERGLLDYDALVTDYWPEYGKNGKENTTIAMVMHHQEGVLVFDRKVEKEDVLDHKRMSKLIENHKPNWEPGTCTGYHSITFGWMVDQIIRRADKQKRGIGDFFREEIAEPYGIDFFIGLPLELEYRVARGSRDADSLLSTIFESVFRVVFKLNLVKWFRKMNSNIPWLSVSMKNGALNDPEIHAMQIASINGIGTARGLAKICSLAVEGKILKKEALEKFKRPVLFDRDVVVGVPIAKAFGFMLGKKSNVSWLKVLSSWQKDHWLPGHPGFGGSNVQFDVDNELAFAYLTNGMKHAQGDLTKTWNRLRQAVYDVLSDG